jgi:tyrosinase
MAKVGVQLPVLHIAGAMPVVSPSSIVLRPDVAHADIGALREAYSKMQAISGTDNRSWIYWAEYHGFNRYDCWHGGRIGNGTHLYPYDLFLPWHRAYLHYWEHATRDQNEEAIPPWWDWTSVASHAEGIPSAYSEPDVGESPNPLATGPMPDMPGDPARQTQRSPSLPGELPEMAAATPSNPSIESLLALESFVDFSSQLQDVHDFIHGWVGGDMGVIGVAAFDPIFWAHHAMIDRIWYLWQLRHGVNNIPNEYLGKVLAPFGSTVEQVLDVRQLGYEYVTSSVSVGVIPAIPGKLRGEPLAPEPSPGPKAGS